MADVLRVVNAALALLLLIVIVHHLTGIWSQVAADVRIRNFSTIAWFVSVFYGSLETVYLGSQARVFIVTVSMVLALIAYVLPDDWQTFPRRNWPRRKRKDTDKPG